MGIETERQRQRETDRQRQEKVEGERKQSRKAQSVVAVLLPVQVTACCFGRCHCSLCPSDSLHHCDAVMK